jgi:hypothetical protein
MYILENPSPLGMGYQTMSFEGGNLKREKRKKENNERKRKKERKEEGKILVKWVK